MQTCFSAGKCQPCRHPALRCAALAEALRLFSYQADVADHRAVRTFSSNSTSGAMYSGVPQVDLDTDCPTSSLLYPKSQIFRMGRGHSPCSIMLSSCAVTDPSFVVVHQMDLQVMHLAIEVKLWSRRGGELMRHSMVHRTCEVRSVSWVASQEASGPHQNFERGEGARPRPKGVQG